MLNYNELKPGVLFIKDGEPCKVLEYKFVRMQQGKPVTQLKIKNLITGKVSDYTARPNDSHEEAKIEKSPAIFIYNKKNEYWFKNPEDPSDRFMIEENIIDDAKDYLKENTEVNALVFQNQTIGIELPIKIELKVVEAPPNIKGSTADGGSKAITTETGLKVNAPPFIEQGDTIRINTETGEYVERVKKGS